MITFGYKSKFSSILRACAAIGIGLVMIAATDAAVTVTKIIAAFLFAAGAVSLAHGMSRKESGVSPLMSINAIVDLVLGVLLFVFPGQVADFIPRLIGVALVIFGAIQAVVLYGAMSRLGSGAFAMVLSVLALVGGVLLVFSPFSLAFMRILAGIFLLIYGVSELMSASKVSKASGGQDSAYGRGYANPSHVDEPAVTISYDDDSEDDDIDASGIADAKEVEFTKEED